MEKVAETVQIDISSEGRIYAKNQVTDYSARGERLAAYNVITFFTDTYERTFQHVDEECHDDEDRSSGAHGRGRPRNEHVPYQNDHPKWRSVERVIRSHPITICPIL